MFKVVRIVIKVHNTDVESLKEFLFQCFSSPFTLITLSGVKITIIAVSEQTTTARKLTTGNKKNALMRISVLDD